MHKAVFELKSLCHAGIATHAAPKLRIYEYLTRGPVWFMVQDLD
jgi:hypothetical protein